MRVIWIATAVLTLAVALFFVTLPDVRPLATRYPSTTAFMEQRKAALAKRGESTRLEWIPVPLSNMAPSVPRAVVAAEDARFYEHQGVDWQAAREALRRDWERRRPRLGGSTITQQLAKNLYLSSARTPWRKLREWAIARRLEQSLSKARILDLYLNVVEFGPRTYGVEAASRRLFGKPASAVTELEAATLAAMLPSPRVYDPVRHPARVSRRAHRILRWMHAGSPRG
jgi:monofunctional biosynthetic peptidoglycan transglycosylase